VTIDGETALKTDADALAKGVNLTDLPGPVTHQARELLKLVFEKNNIFFDRWRNVQLYGFPGWANGPELDGRRAAEVKRLDEVIATKESKIDAVRQPKSHHFEIKPTA